MSWALAMVVAMVIDAMIGWPAPVFRRIGHPVTWIGRLISALEGRWNTGSTRRRFVFGFVTTLLTVMACILIASALSFALPQNWIGTVIVGILAWPLVAVRSMYTHVADVARPLVQGDVPAARYAVSMIVGRDPAQLDKPAIARATLESLAENTSDGIVAPIFWGALFGLPGIAAYKAINTLDSMIGHRNSRYEYFGKAAARLDDGVNLLPSRLTGVLFALTCRRPWRALRCVLRDARLHRSPNAGWPEAALAGALGVRLSGPRVYGDQINNEPWINDTCPDPDPRDIWRGLRQYTHALLALALGLVLWALLRGA